MNTAEYVLYRMSDEAVGDWTRLLASGSGAFGSEIKLVCKRHSSRKGEYVAITLMNEFFRSLHALTDMPSNLVSPISSRMISPISLFS